MCGCWVGVAEFTLPRKRGVKTRGTPVKGEGVAGECV